MNTNEWTVDFAPLIEFARAHATAIRACKADADDSDDLEDSQFLAFLEMPFRANVV
jgi:hypothetical protein